MFPNPWLITLVTTKIEVVLMDKLRYNFPYWYSFSSYACKNSSTSEKFLK